eukprot:gene15384-15525_t
MPASQVNGYASYPAHLPAVAAPEVPIKSMTIHHQEAMQQAVRLSHEKMLAGAGGPFGAVVVLDNKIIGSGWNQVTSLNDPTAHAEPCPMCLAAAFWARIDKIYYANTRQDAASIGFDDEFFYQELAKPFHHRQVSMEQMGRDEAIKAPGTWEEMEVYAEKLRQAGYTAFTTAWPAAYLLEHFSDKGFDVGFGVYPYWAKMVPNGPYALNVGGTSIWILDGHPSYGGVIEFISYLASEKVQQKWHETTGYLPTTIGAYEKTKAGRYYKENPVSRLAVEQVIERANQDLPNGMRITNYGPVVAAIVRSSPRARLGFNKDALDEGRVVAEAYLKEHKKTIKIDAHALVGKLRPQMAFFIENPQALSQALNEETDQGELGEILKILYTDFEKVRAAIWVGLTFANVLQALFLQRQPWPSLEFTYHTPGTPVIFDCDAQQLSQVLTNLLQNAINAVTESGKDETGKVSLKVEVQDDHLLITVEDNGPGFPKNGRDRLLEPYYTTRTKGTGLGLAIDILIVDDEADIRDLISGILSDEGYTARTASDGLAALDMIKARQPNLVILDVWLERVTDIPLLAQSFMEQAAAAQGVLPRAFSQEALAREAFEREYLLTQVQRFSGNISQTARFIGMERSALHRKLRALGVHEGKSSEFSDEESRFASHPDVLKQAGAEEADLLIAVTASDEVNMIACEAAQSLFQVETKIARIRHQSYLKPAWSNMFSPDRLAIDVIISPEIEVARALDRSTQIPGAFEHDDISQAMEAFGYYGSDSRRMVIIGGGSIGKTLAMEIELNQPDIVAKLIEKDQGRSEVAARLLKNIEVLHGDALDYEVLAEANVQNAETVVAVTDDDKVNILSSLLAKRCGAGRVDAVINPRAITVSTILQHVRQARLRSVHTLGDNYAEVIEAEARETSHIIGLTVDDVTIKGLWASRSVKTLDDYATGNRSYSSLFIFATLSSSFIGGGFTSGLAEKVYRMGLFYVIGLWGDAVSVGDIMGRLYGENSRIFTGIASVLVCAGIAGAQFGAFGYMMNVLLGIPQLWGILIGASVVIIYSSLGGMKAVAGGIEAILSTPNFDTIGRDIPWFALLGIFISFFCGETLVPPYVQRLLIGKDNRLIAHKLSPNINPNLALPHVIMTVMPVGLKGLAIAGIIAVVMSSADSFLNAAGIAASHDVIKPLRSITEKHQELIISRFTTLTVGVMGAVFAASTESVLDILLYAYNFWTPFILVPLVAGIMGYVRPAQFDVCIDF